MRVVLKVTGGPHKGQHRVLHRGQTLRIGRSDWAELCCHLDESLSRLHFEVIAGEDGCEIVDLNSRNGTFVNGRPIQKALLKDGDEVRAGASKFALGVSGDNPLTASSKSDLRYVEAASDPQLAAGLKGRLAARFDSKALPSGWSSYRGRIEEAAPGVLAELLQQAWPVHLLYDPHRAAPLPEDAPGAILFDWLPAAAAAAMSPVFLSASELPGWSELLAAGWGQDAVVTLFSPSPQDELLAGLRAACAMAGNGGVSGLCWPTILSAILTSQGPEETAKVLPNVMAVLLESREAPDTWLLFGREPLHDRLRKFGLKPQAVESPTAADMDAISS
ncbi:MAG: FHA domain-containing protein [Planctomyces sp.]|nr:FHA domain-containing protein [Planctomyces sp.]